MKLVRMVCFFQQLYREKLKQDTLWRRHFFIPMIYGPHTYFHIYNHIHYDDIISENKGGGGAKTVWNFFSKIRPIW